MATPSSSLALLAATFDSLELLEQTQSVNVAADNTLVEAKGAADRYSNKQITKQKQLIEWEGHWLNENLTPNVEATNLSIGLWTLGGTAYLAQLKGGTLDITTSGPEVSGIAELNEFMIPTMTDVTISSNLMVVTQDALNYLNMTADEGGFAVTVSIQWAKGGDAVGEGVTFPGILRSTKQSVVRDGVQLEDCVITMSAGVAQTAPTVKYNGSNETTSLIYLALLGAAVSAFSVDFGTMTYANAEGQTAIITKLAYRFTDKQVIEQSISMEVQGALTATEGS